ncbi:MAG: AI-2E family transporter [Planctomycetota bacterium]|nr:AI-2E family transporter [Planctomycetota bacterium]
MTTSSNQSVQTFCLAVIAVAVLTYMVFWLRPVLVPFVVALFVVSGITPILETVERHLKVNRLIASVIAFVAGLFVLLLLSICLWGSVQQLANQGTAYRTRIAKLLTNVQSWVPASLLPTSTAFGFGDAQADDSPSAESSSEETQVTSEATSGVASDDSEPADSLAENNQATDLISGLASFRNAIDGFVRRGLGQITSALLEFFSTSVVVLIYVFFILLGSEDSTRLTPSISAVDQQVRSYLFLKTVISILTGLVFGAALWLFGVPMALTFGLLAFLLNYIPNIGPVVASLLPIPFILLSPDGSALWMVAAIIVTMAIQVVSGSVVEPKLMGDSSDLHPVVILLALMFWGMMWGITGMFLATPITAGIKIVMEGYTSTKPIANLMAGRFDRTDRTEPSTETNVA